MKNRGDKPAKRAASPALGGNKRDLKSKEVAQHKGKKFGKRSTRANSLSQASQGATTPQETARVLRKGLLAKGRPGDRNKDE